MNDYFDIPTQVMFWDEGDKQYTFGIAYKDEIICGCCGGIFEIEDIIELTPEDKHPIYSYGDNWADLRDAIFGDVYPEGYEFAGQA